MQHLVSKLNPPQLAGVLHERGPLLVLAGAGSGKTRVITTRIAYLVAERGYKPSSILALTFTNKAAREMKERVVSLLGKGGAKGLFCGTFHAFCVKLLREHAPLIGYREKFSIFNTPDKLHLLGQILADFKISPDALTPEDVAWKISDAKNALLMPSRFQGDPIIGDVYGVYQQTLKGFNIVDFDDLLMLAVQLFREQPELAARCGAKYRQILVDEYQDTNQAQYALLRALTAAHDDLVVVGDDDQSIYGWRGADIQNILNFERDFPGAEVIRLEQNYRSTGVILAAANAVIAHNASRKGKKLWTAGDQGEPIRVVAATDEDDEAACVYDGIVALRKDDARYRQMAVVFRTNFQTRPIEELLTRHGVPYEVVGGTRFFDRKEVKDLLCYLRLIANRQDEVALLRVINRPKRGIGPQTIEKVIRHAEANGLTLWQTLGAIDAVEGVEGPQAHQIAVFTEVIEEFARKIFGARAFSTAVRQLVQAINYEDELLRDAGGDQAKYQKSLGYVQAFVNGIALYERDEDIENPGLFDYLERIALMSADEQPEDEEAKRDAVTILTLHACKGLEFPYVFLCGVEEGNIPHARSIEDRPEAVEEERRLFYVGVTRAMRRLFLSFAEVRHKYGETEEREPSRFLDEIPRELLDWTSSGELAELGEDEMVASLEEMKRRFQ